MYEDKEQQVRELIQELYEKCYISKLKVIRLHHGWDVVFAFNLDPKPIHISAQLPWEDFLKFLREELRSRHWYSDHYYTGYKHERDLEGILLYGPNQILEHHHHH